MFCARCGKEIDNDSTFCPFCGQKVDAPVENKKSFQPSVLGNIKTVKLVGGIAVGLVILFGVIFGIGKLTGGSDTEETAEALSPSVETQESAAAESQKETDAKSDTELSEVKSDTDAESDIAPPEVKSDTDGMLTLYSWQMEPYLRNFFDLQAEIIGKHRSKNGGAFLDDCDTIEDLLEYSGVFILDERVNLPADYNSELYKPGMYESARVIANEYNKFKIRYNRPASYYDLQVEIVDSNVGSSFRYYPGTDAVIFVKLRFRFLCLDTAQYSPELWKDCPYSNDLYASFVKSTEGEKWLLSGLTTEESYVDLSKKLINESKYTTDVHIDGIDLQTVMDAYASACSNMPFYYDQHALVYLDGDNIPELILRKEEAHIDDDIYIFSYQNDAVVHLAENKDGELFECIGSGGEDLSDIAELYITDEFCEHENAIIYHRYLPSDEDVWYKLSIEDGTFVCRAYDSEEEVKAGLDFKMFNSITYYASLSDAFKTLVNTSDE